MEQPLPIPASLFQNRLRIRPTNQCRRLGSIRDHTAVTALSPERHRRHIRAVRLDQDAVKRHIHRGFLQFRRFLEGHRPRKADEVPQFQVLLRNLPAAGKAVNDNPDALQDAINNAVTLLTEKVANVRLLGDVNNDGSVTTDDSALLLRSAAELDTLDDAATVSADMNQDGIADTSDAVLILQTAAEF